MTVLSACAQAYIEEYGAIPSTPAERDRYNTFRFGWEAGHRDGLDEGYTDAIVAITKRQETR